MKQKLYEVTLMASGCGLDLDDSLSDEAGLRNNYPLAQPGNIEIEIEPNGDSNTVVDSF
jgi:hypothetical protein